jgi:hypothetical protein
MGEDGLNAPRSASKSHEFFFAEKASRPPKGEDPFSIDEGLSPEIAHAFSPEALSQSSVAGTGHGALMEPSGRNRWQPVANGSALKTAQIGRLATGGNPRQRFRSAW